jgi:8-oxo-dGTP pyrophosphatase MutT (NUDIX family)
MQKGRGNAAFLVVLEGEHRAMIQDRPAARAIVLTPEREALLMRIRPEGRSNSFWITPGGGLEAGEGVEDGLRRELAEELGLVRFDIGPLVWRRQHTFDWSGRRVCQREEYRVVHASRFDPRMTDAAEIKVLERFHWWPIAELAATDEIVTPATLAEIVNRYLADGPPAEVPPVEILVD